MFSILQKLAAKGISQVTKFGNRDMMQATVAGAVLVAFADGDLADSEVESLHKIIESNPALSAFGNEIGKTLDNYIAQMKASRTLGRVKLMREIEDVKASPKESEEVFAVMVTIAEADGNVAPEEQMVLSAVARKLGLNPADFGI
jgi:tellurite resistance protein TerB